jgi:hypothetical protein
MPKHPTPPGRQTSQLCLQALDFRRRGGTPGGDAGDRISRDAIGESRIAEFRVTWRQFFLGDCRFLVTVHLKLFDTPIRELRG